MSNYAKIDSENIVENVIVCDDSNIPLLGGTYVKETEETGSASVGFTWNKEKNKFIKLQPYGSWTLNEDSCEWEAPVSKPASPWMGYWNEDSQEWVELLPSTEE